VDGTAVVLLLMELFDGADAGAVAARVSMVDETIVDREMPNVTISTATYSYKR
jgi:hypothetical protein